MTEHDPTGRSGHEPTPPTELIITTEPEFPGQVVWECGSTLGIAPDEATARADAAALAQPEPEGRPTPAPAGADGELVAWLAGQAVRAADCRQPKAAGMLTWAAQVVGEHADPVDRQAVPVPVAIADRLPTPSECDRGRCWWGRQVNSRRWSWTFSIDPQGDTHWLPATVERLPANIVPLLPEDAQVIEPAQHTILAPAPVPVPVAERLPGPEDCISNPRNGQGEWCWGWVQHDPPPYSGRWRMMRREWVADDAVAWLPATALPLPQVEVQP